MTEFECVMHGVDYRTGPECGPDCERMTKARWAADHSADARAERGR